MVDVHSNFATCDSYIGTGDGGKRHFAFTSKGYLWFGHRQGGNLLLFCASPLGALSVQAGDSGIANGVLTCAGEWSMFIDETDAIHITYAKYAGASSDGRTDKATIMYRHGVLSASHTGITWSAELSVTGYDYWHSPDVVAHEHNGQIRAHVVCGYNWAGDNRVLIFYQRILINKNDSVNHVVETSFSIHDTTSSQAFCSKPSIELRHSGDGKTPQLVAGVRTPDIFISYTISSSMWFCRLRWSTPNTWNIQNQFSLSTWGNLSSPTAAYGGLYEHHRWQRTLYSARDSRICVIGWVCPATFASQHLALWEVTPGQNTLAVGVALINWTGSTQVAYISGTAAILPDGNIDVIGNGANDPWHNQVIRAQITRPKGSNTRTISGAELVHSGAWDGNGAHADMHHCPPGGENHVVYRTPDTWMWYWRNNRGCNWVHTGSGVARRPKYRMHADGVSLVPVAERA